MWRGWTFLEQYALFEKIDEVLLQLQNEPKLNLNDNL
jgi:hypothetical protein